MPKLHEILKLNLKARGMSAASLARMCGLHQRGVEHVVRGVRLPSVNALLKFCKALNLSADELLGLKQTKKDVTRENDFLINFRKLRKSEQDVIKDVVALSLRRQKKK